MSDYNAKIYHEQGASVLRAESGGSIAVEAGATIAGAGTVNLSGGINTASNVTGASITAVTRLWLGSNIEFMWGQINAVPTVSASPGSIFIRSDGSMSRLYINMSEGAEGVSGSVWKTASNPILDD